MVLRAAIAFRFEDIFDVYTSMRWAPLCKEVAKLEPQLGTLEGDDPDQLTSTQNAQWPDPKKLWDVRRSLKKVIVEAPGIDSRNRCTGNRLQWGQSLPRDSCRRRIW